MIHLHNGGVFLVNGQVLPATEETESTLAARYGLSKAQAADQTMAAGILKAHNQSGNDQKLQLRFDKMASHDITYVGIIQTARASGLTQFPMPYVLTNCHNSLCAVGGTINEDDHLFGLSAAKKYGGIYVPAHQAVIHQYMREMMAACGNMILGSDSHTRYGALGTMAIGEGGPELVKQLLNKTYDVDRPPVVCIHLTGTPRPGVGPQDVALALIGAVFGNGYVKNKILEFVGDGIANLSMDYRNGIDVMTTETACLSSIWATDETTRGWYVEHGRPEDYKPLAPGAIAYYDGCVEIDLSRVEPMIALPFHPSNTYTLAELIQNPHEILAEVEKAAQSQLESDTVKIDLLSKIHDGGIWVDQGVIAGCAGGTFENLCDAADILRGQTIGCDAFSLSLYPSSQPVFLELLENGRAADLMATGATLRSAFCGPCFGAGDVPNNEGLSIRHSTRNFPNREGSKITNGQIASVALMDARSIAATARNHGKLTSALELEPTFSRPAYHFHKDVYENRCYFGYGKPQPATPLVFGPNITDWPAMHALTDDLLVKVVSVILDPVTTTDELIPSGETSSYRSNPLGLAEFTLSRKDPAYVGRAKEIQKAEQAREAGEDPLAACPELAEVFRALQEQFPELTPDATGIGSAVFARKPGDGSAREQAASCQRVLGGWANIATEYATKRYRSNLINWGLLPFLLPGEPVFENGDYLFVPGIRQAVAEKAETIPAWRVSGGKLFPLTLSLGNLTDDERQIILDGCLINFYRA